MAALHFQFRPVLTLAGVVAVALLIALGTWQLRRLEWKQALIEQVSSRADAAPMPFEEAVRRTRAGENMEYAPVHISGQLLEKMEARVFGTYDGAAGVYVFAPLKTNQGAVYVNRGFVPQALVGDDCFCSDAESAAPIIGLFRVAVQPSPPASWFQAEQKSADGLWTRRDPVAFGADAGLDAAPFYIDQFSVEGRDWPKGGTTRLEFSNRHMEYALTWFGLAATLAGVWLVFSLQKRG